MLKFVSMDFPAPHNSEVPYRAARTTYETEVGVSQIARSAELVMLCL
jgi:hypothetical protein